MTYIMDSPWLIVALAAGYIWTCIRIGITASQYGRRWWVWFLISLFLTAIPAAIFLWVDYIRLKRKERLEEDDEDDDDDQPAEPVHQPVSPQAKESEPTNAQGSAADSKPHPAAAIPSETTVAVQTAPAEQQPEETEESTTLLPEHAIVCPSCHSILQPGQTARIGGILKCLKCGLPIDEIKLA